MGAIGCITVELTDYGLGFLEGMFAMAWRKFKVGMTEQSRSYCSPAAAGTIKVSTVTDEGCNPVRGARAQSIPLLSLRCPFLGLQSFTVTVTNLQLFR